MRQKLLVSLVLAAVLVEATGCAGTKPIVRGQSPERRVDLARLRRRIRRDVEPVLDATKEVTRKGLVIGGIVALLGASYWLWNEEENYKSAHPFDPMFDPAPSGQPE